MPCPLSLKGLLREYWIIFLAPVLLLGPLLARGEVLFWGTPSLQFIPWWVAAWDNLRQGALPLWNPMNGMGAPLLANYQLAFFYPPNWLLLFLAALGRATGSAAAAIAVGFTFLAMLHMAWGGLGMAVLLRRMRFPWLAQVTGGLAFGLSGYIVARLGFFSMVWVAAWLPWVIYFADQIASVSLGWKPGKEPVPLEQPKFNLIPGLVGCLAMQLLAGHAQLTWYTLLLAGAWVTVAAWRSGGYRQAGWAWLSLGAAALVATGLAAIQLVPTFEYLRLSQRASAFAYEEALAYSFWPWRVITLFSPDFFGNPASGDYWGYASYWEDHLYAGLAPLLLAVATLWLLLKGLFPTKRPARWGLLVFAWVLVLVAFGLGLGKNTPLFPFLFRHVPTFSMFQAPARYLIWVAFTIPILAAVGIEHWRCPTGRGLYWFRLGTAGAFAISLGAGLASIFMENVSLTFIRATALTGMWAFGFGLLTLVLPYAQKKGRYGLWMWVAVGWTLADLLFTGWGLNPGARLSLYTKNETGIERARLAASDQRIFLNQREEYDLKFVRFLRFKDFRPLEDWSALRGALIPNLNLLEGISSANNFDPLLMDSYKRWMDQLETLSPMTQTAWLAYLGVGAEEHIDASQVGGVRYDPIPGSQRWHWFSCKKSVSGLEEAMGEIFKEQNAPPRLGRAVILEDGLAEKPAGCSTGANITEDKKSAIRLLSERPDRILLEVDAPNSGWFVLMDSWYPGWLAWVDDAPVPLYRADGLFRAVGVGQGKHKIKMEYHPRGFYFGALFSILTVLCTGLTFPKWSLGFTKVDRKQFTK